LKTYTIANFSELFQTIQKPYKFIGRSDVIWWRGEAKDEHLIPGIFRKNRIKFDEGRLFNEFRLQSEVRHNKTPKEYDSWLFLMQHYGLPTRLLDWSESILVALYFTCNEHGWSSPYREGEIDLKYFEEEHQNTYKLINEILAEKGVISTKHIQLNHKQLTDTFNELINFPDLVKFIVENKGLSEVKRKVGADVVTILKNKEKMFEIYPKSLEISHKGSDFNKSGILWGLKPTSLNESQSEEGSKLERILYDTDVDPIKAIVDAIHNGNEIKDDKVYAIFPKHSDLRHFVQSTRFTMHCSKKPLEDIKKAENFLVKFEVLPKAKIEILEVLQFLRITEDYIFPDLDHLSNSLKNNPRMAMLSR
jgi:hypothetical protein